jgi:uncharacterized protein YndB with AHSA1/START domain
VKKVLIAIGGVIVALMLVVLVGGALMPREHVAASTVVIPAPQDSVWHVVRDIEATPAWWDGLDRVERVDAPDGPETWRHHMSSGAIDLAIERAEAPRLLVTRIVADANAPFGGIWTYQLESAGAATRVTITEAGYINSKVFRFVAGTLMGMHGTMDSYLSGLSRRFGGSEQPTHVEQ